MPFRKISLIVNTQKERAADAAKDIMDYLAKRGQNCVMTASADIISGSSAAAHSIIEDDTDLVLVLGGDGTVLGAVRDIGDRDIPVLGINLGTLGYLAEIELAEYRTALDRVLNDEVHCEKRMMLEGRRIRNDGHTVDPVNIRALNDIVISRYGSLRMLPFNVYIGGRFFHTFSADGMIISTPTGSTAYNFSAGGPIVEPDAELFLLTPICPHSIFSRSIVLSTKEPITIEIGEGKRSSTYEAQAAFDGDRELLMEAGDRIEIIKSSKYANLVRLSFDSFLNTLRQKMGNTI